MAGAYFYYWDPDIIIFMMCIIWTGCIMREYKGDESDADRLLYEAKDMGRGRYVMG